MKSKSILFLIFAACLSSFPAQATQVFKGRVLHTVTAGSDKLGDQIDATAADSASFQCVWSGLGGTVDGTVQVKVSNDGGTSWDTKSGASITLTGSSGHETLSLNGVAMEAKYRLDYSNGSISSGTLDCYAILKGFGK